nr:YceI family protein [uncultured Carboxylicivirga sp.]
MKTVKLVLAALFVMASASSFAQKKEIKSDDSKIVWTGKKIAGSHTGEIDLKNGYLVLEKGKLTGGKFVIDMNSITNTDLEDEGYNAKLVGHLKSDDFFGVEKYPTSEFVITKVTELSDDKVKVSGTLTIKGKSEDISFDAVKKGKGYTAQIEVDRSKYDVRYGSGSFFDNLGDKAIDDIFTLDIDLAI